MGFEPQKFFIGVIEFFSVILPGAVLAYALKHTDLQWLPGPRITELQGAEAWAIFLFASYLLGHFLFLVGSLLDDYVYGPIRQSAHYDQITRLLKGEDLSPRLARWLATFWFNKHLDAMDRVVAVKDNYLSRLDATESVNAFQWAKLRIAIECPQALTIVNRFEADSKFFRSFVPVLFGLMTIALAWRQWLFAAASAVLLGFAFWRYVEQRFKSIQQAYWTVLTLEAAKPVTTPNSAPVQPITHEQPVVPTHAGGVVFRERAEHTEYLLVRAKKDPSQWVLPKGHIEPGETAGRCAVREVREETGVWARIVRPLRSVRFTKDEKPVAVLFFLMKAVEEGEPEDRGREHQWFSLDDAATTLTHPENSELLRELQQQATS